MAKSEHVQTNRDYSKTLTIEVGVSESETIDISGSNLVGLIVSTDITGDFIHFLVSDSINGTYLPAKTNVPKTNADDPIAFNIGLNVDGGGSYSFKPEDLAAWQFLQIKTVTNIAGSEVAVNQLTNPAPITLVLRPIS